MLGKDAMKNIYLRLAVIGGVVALGATAIGQSMMASRATPDPEPIEVSQNPKEDGVPTPAVSPFPNSQVMLASNESPAESSATEATTTANPAAADSIPKPPVSRFRIADDGTAAGATSPTNSAGSSTSATLGDENPPPSRFSQFLNNSSRSPAENPAAETVGDASATAAAGTAASRFSGSSMPSGTPEAPPVSRFGNPAASTGATIPPTPQSFAAETATSAPTTAAGMTPPPTRFQASDSALVEEAAGQVSAAAGGLAAEVNDAVAETTSAAHGAVEEAGSRFSSMVNSASQAISDQANTAADAVEESMPSTLPTQPRYGSNAYPSSNYESAGGYPSSVHESGMPNNPNRFSATPAPTTPAASDPVQPSVVGSSVSSDYNGTRGFSATAPSPAPAGMEATPSPAPVSQPAATRFADPPAIASRATPPVTGMLASARPGEARWEGDQTPSIRLEKVAPPEVQIGKVTTFELHVENNGRIEASNVMVQDMVPAGTKLVSTSPQATQNADGTLVWNLGTLQPRERKTLKLEILPMEEGNIGSVASVTFAAKASAKSVVTRPDLQVTQASSATVLAGNQLGITITISNPGTGAATGVVLEENVPENFSHPAGKELEFEVGTLRPGESRQLDLVLSATSAGRVKNILRARADGNLSREHGLDLEVVAPKLAIAMNGPKLRYLERPAKYTVSVSNPGTAPAHEIDLVTYLPKGLKFVEANNAGQYDSTRHAVFWNLQELPPAQTGTVELVALPIEAGDQRLRVEGTASKGLSAEDESTVHVEGLAAIFFEVADLADPIEVGKETTYDIKIVNQGSKEATNVQVLAEIPQGMKGISASGEANGEIQGQIVRFQPISRIDPKQTVRLKIQVQGTMPGNQRIKVQVSTDGIPAPITKEESTTIYADR
ncbi:hypothetical protein [Blastopirellula marina]|nr:hypothetical protein [Blastopirellula marina]